MNEYSQMVASLAKPGEDIIASLTPAMAHTLHMAIGLAGEAGELLEHYCEAGIKHSSYIEELGDAEFYFEGLCQSMRIEMELTGTTSDDPLSVPRYVVSTTDMLDLVKKMVIYNKEIDLMDFVNKLANVRRCMDQAASYYSITQAEAKAHNLHKLLKGKNARYSEGSYSDIAAQTRRDKSDIEGATHRQTEIDKTAEVRKVFKIGDWVFGLNEHKGCSQVFEGENGQYHPFSYLNDYDSANYRIATQAEIENS